MHFYIKLGLPTKFPSQADKEICIEIKQTELSSNRKWPFFPGHNYYYSVHSAIIFRMGITHQLLLPCIVHISSTLSNSIVFCSYSLF